MSNCHFPHHCHANFGYFRSVLWHSPAESWGLPHSWVSNRHYLYMLNSTATARANWKSSSNGCRPLGSRRGSETLLQKETLNSSHSTLDSLACTWIYRHFQIAETPTLALPPRKASTFFTTDIIICLTYKKGVGAPVLKGSQGAKVFGKSGSGGGIKPSGLN